MMNDELGRGMEFGCVFSGNAGVPPADLTMHVDDCQMPTSWPHMKIATFVVGAVKSEDAGEMPAFQGFRGF